MDPEKCLLELLELLSEVDRDRDAVVEHLEDLREWTEGWGFMPAVMALGDRSFKVLLVPRVVSEDER